MGMLRCSNKLKYFITNPISIYFSLWILLNHKLAPSIIVCNGLYVFVSQLLRFADRNAQLYEYIDP
jgi:hypothetical protein